MTDRHGHPRLALASATVSVIALIGGWTYAASLQPPGIGWAQESISALAAQATPHRWAMTTAFVLTGLGYAVTAATLPRLQRPGRIVLGVAGVATILLAALPLPAAGEGSLAHTMVAGTAFVALAVWPWWLVRAGPLQRGVTTGFVVLVASLLMTIGTPAFGVHERLVAAALALWPWVNAVALWWAAGHRIGGAKVRTTVGFAGLVVLCLAAGVAMTAVNPATTHTRHYTAQLSLSADPRDTSRVVSSTSFGDLEIAFSGWAPGVDVLPQVEASITDLLARPDLGVAGLRPGPLELREALQEGAFGLAWRFALGASLAAALVGMLTWSLGRRRRPPADEGPMIPLRKSRRIGVLVLAPLTACALVTGASWSTYRGDRVVNITSTGLLGMVQQNAALLDDVEARSQQVSPYLRNLIALSSALQQQYRPTALNAPEALRLLLVSDQHGANQFALMRTIIEAQSIDAVVDSGDLVNFGTVAEAEAAGLFDGIASLGVPYLFVLGNHDASQAADVALLDRLARIPNVVLLQPTWTTWNAVDLNGIRITGFNDPRWFGDDATRTAAKQKPAVAAFEEAYAGQPAPDLLVSHEPTAVRGLDAGVLVNGHIHTADLEGNRIQVGTFSGGGPFTHFVETQEGSELVGQPSAFDILTFGEDCRALSLTRYQFQDVLEGRPAYDSVILVNGARIDTRPPDETRRCGPSSGLTVESVRVLSELGPKPQ